MRLVTSEQMRHIEDACVEAGIPLDTLMQRAGAALAELVNSLDPSHPVLILVGPGNNGGDGLVAADGLRASGRNVSIYTFHRSSSPLDAIRAEDDADLAQLGAHLSGHPVVVDALLGIGQNRPVEGLLAGILEACNEVDLPARVAADIPTGVDADTGRVLGVAFRASTTLCMGCAKVGAVSAPAAEYAGRIEVASIGIPPHLTEIVTATMPDAPEIARLLPRRERESNKGSYGRVLVIGGSADFTGAPALSTLAALRSGAGLVQVASTADVVRAVGFHALEPIFAELPQHDGRISPEALPSISRLMQHATAMVIGPGLGHSDGTRQLVGDLVQSLAADGAPPALVDADGLNALSEIDGWWKKKGRLVLTPHPGEMSRLTGMSIPDIQKDRVTVAREFSRRWGVVVVLKGSRTLVADPAGQIAINPTGGPNLATGGTGDVLSGLIGGLLAQKMRQFEAATAGVYLHGAAGDILARRHGDSGTLAGDLPAHIPVARLEVLKQAGEATT